MIKRLCSGRRVEDNANSEICFSLARKWMTTCLEEHGELCPFTTTSTMPTRVIDIGPNDGSQLPRLYVTNGQRGPWVSLSHCWGKISQFVTDTQNLGERQKGIYLDDLPLTFRDAVEVTRRLGQQYLWVDSLCIIQNSREDWVQESSRMFEYYRHSVLTIAVDSSSGDHEGFLLAPRSHLKRRSVPFGIHVPGEGIHQIYLDSYKPINRLQSGTTHLTSRAWTLQEDLLSPRSLHYTSDQLVWQCYTQTYCESDINPIESPDNLKRLFLAPTKSSQDLEPSDDDESIEPTLSWYSIVSDFAVRSLTFEEDRLPAISGIAREIQAINHFTYKAGIWMEDVSRGLAWCAYGYGQRTKEYRAPSWSWAALEHPILAFSTGTPSKTYESVTFLNKYKPRVQRPGPIVLACEVVSADGDPFGCVSSGYIKLRGRIIQASKCKGNWPPYFIAYWKDTKDHFLPGFNLRVTPGIDQLLYHFDIFTPGSDENTVVLEPLIFLQLSTWDWSDGRRGLITIALILEPVNILWSYKRVGIVHIPNHNGLAENGWETKDITII
jgi:hypothetical protein